MPDCQPLLVYFVNDVEVRVYPTSLCLAVAAAADGAATIRWAIQSHGKARVVLTAAQSQSDMLEALVQAPDIDWSRVSIFPMSEYMGLPSDHPCCARRWFDTHFLNRVDAQFRPLRGDAPDIGNECARYSEMLLESPIDLVFAGIAENAGVAFNQPESSSFEDPATVRVVRIDDTYRRQLVHEIPFVDLAAVPTHAYTLTLPALMRGRRIICAVPDARKAESIRSALEGPLTHTCPSSLLNTHHNATIYLDTDSASMLSRPLSRVYE